jgi:hypothetical protein
MSARMILAAAWLLATVACGSTPARIMTTPTPETLPPMVLEFIDSRWPTGKVSAPPPGGACATPGATPAAVVSGDFNGDGVPDLAVRVAAAEGTHLVHAMARRLDFAFYDAPLEGDLASASIVVRPRGEQFVPASGVADYFGSDTAVAVCGKSTTGYFWNGLGVVAKTIGG